MPYRSEWPDGEPREHAEKLAELVRAGALSQAVELCQATGLPLDLRGADLSETTCLYSADLRGADLRGANLEYASLAEANLSGVNLSGANLKGVNLDKTDLRGANLTGVNLRGADLYSADLRGADLRGADLGGRAHLKNAKHDHQTRWPDGFDVAGMDTPPGPAVKFDSGAPWWVFPPC